MDSYIFDPVEAAGRIMSELEKQYKSLIKLNVMVIGKTGAGKSTLINSMFTEDIAKTGTGKPVSAEIIKYEKPDFPLAIYDTPGLELGGDNSVEGLLLQVKTEVEKCKGTQDISQMIHCIWYCVSTPSHRFEQQEASFISKLAEAVNDVPIIIVLTQSYAKKDAIVLEQEILKENLRISGVVKVLAADFYLDFDDEPVCKKAFGLDELVELMQHTIPESVTKTLIAIQKVSLEMKQKEARKVIAVAAASAAATGAIPIPFSDAALLVPEQIGMIAKITAVFRIPMDKATISAIVTATIGTGGATVLGKTIVTNLLKLIPGAGSAVGGAISAATAAALTAALGEAYITVISKVYTGEHSLEFLQSVKGKEEIAKAFIEQLKIKRDSTGKPEKG